MSYGRFCLVVVAASVAGFAATEAVLAEDYGAQYGGMEDLAGQLQVPGSATRLNQIRFPGQIATRQTRTVRQRNQLYGGLSLGTPKKVGRLAVRPGLSLEGKYTDNVYQSPESSDSDWQGIARPAVIVDVPGFLGTQVGRKNRLAVGAHAYLLKSLEHSREMSTKQWGFFMDGGFNVVDFDSGGSPWKLVITDALDHGAVPPTFEGDNWRNYWANTFSVVGGYHLAEKWSAELGYTCLWREYRQREADVDDHKENALTGRIYYKIAPKTSVFLGGTRSWADRDQDHSLDTDNYFASVGMQWNATEKLNGEIAVTYQEKEYTRDAHRRLRDRMNNITYRERIDDGDILGYRANVVYRPAAKWTFVLGGRRSVEETWVVDGDLLSGPYYDMTNVSLTAEWQLVAKWFVSAQAGYTFSDFEGNDLTNDSLDDVGMPLGVHRKDEFVTGGLGLRWRTHDRLTLSFEYRYDQNKSKVKGFDYDRHTATLTAMIAL